MVLARLGVRAEASALAQADFGVMYTSLLSLSPAQLVSSVCRGNRAAAAWRRRRICCSPTATALLSFAMAVAEYYDRWLSASGRASESCERRIFLLEISVELVMCGPKFLLAVKIFSVTANSVTATLGDSSCTVFDTMILAVPYA